MKKSNSNYTINAWWWNLSVCLISAAMMSWVPRELSWLFTNRFSATRYMKVKRMGITEILRRIWLFSANKIKSSESVSKQPSQLIVELNSSLWQKLGTLVPKIKKSVKSLNNMSSDEILCKIIFVYRHRQLAIVQDRHFYKFSHLVILKIKHYKKTFPK